jgi:hypothetical protein
MSAVRSATSRSRARCRVRRPLIGQPAEALTRLRGRAPRGQRLIGRVPWGHWKTTTFVAGLRHDRVVAPLVLDGAMNGQAFRAFVEQFLVPTLAGGDIVMADDLASHNTTVTSNSRHLSSPGFADELVGCEASEGLEPRRPKL